MAVKIWNIHWEPRVRDHTQCSGSASDPWVQATLHPARTQLLTLSRWPFFPAVAPIALAHSLIHLVTAQSAAMPKSTLPLLLRKPLILNGLKWTILEPQDPQTKKHSTSTLKTWPCLKTTENQLLQTKANSCFKLASSSSCSTPLTKASHTQLSPLHRIKAPQT